MKNASLSPCSRDDFHQLLVHLWCFVPCNTSSRDHIAGRCKDIDCSFRRTSGLDAFFSFYGRVCVVYTKQPHTKAEPALRCHKDLFELIGLLRENPNFTREEFTQRCLVGHAIVAPSTPAQDGDRAIDLAVRVMTMINTQSQDPFSDTIEHSASYHTWTSNVSFRDFVRNSFPIPLQPVSLGDNEFDAGDMSILWNLTASRLAKRAKLKFKPTDDISRHLLLDRKMHVVEIFHHVAFVKENLRLSHVQTQKEALAEEKQIEVIPRQIALEILDSIQRILFRHSSPASRALLRYLVSHRGFDPECLNFEASALRSPEENDVQFIHFGSRMADLCAEIEHPAPNGWVERWMERRSGGRYIMMATLIGVLFAVILGILGLVVSIFQAYVSYQAWKHPIQQ